MPEPGPSRQSRGVAALFAAALVASAGGVLGWHLLQNRGSEKQLDVSGFDLSAAPSSHPAAPPPPAPSSEPAPARSGLGFLKADEGIRVAGEGGSSSAARSPEADRAKRRKEAALSFAQAARKHEGRVRAYFLKATRRHPSVRRYGRDWMSYPDLKRLNDEYFRDRDALKFMTGLARSDNFPKLVRKYAADPAIRAVVVDAAKQAPADLMSASLDVLQNDRVVRDLLGGVAKGLGLPASLTAVFDEGKGGKVDEARVFSDIMKSDPEARQALERQANPGVQLSR